jgi:hypothetical protein
MGSNPILAAIHPVAPASPGEPVVISEPNPQCRPYVSSFYAAMVSR